MGALGGGKLLLGCPVVMRAHWWGNGPGVSSRAKGERPRECSCVQTCCLLPPAPRARAHTGRSAVEQLVEVSQTRAIADALVKLRQGLAGRGGAWQGRSLAQLLDALDAEMDEQASG